LTNRGFGGFLVEKNDNEKCKRYRQITTLKNSLKMKISDLAPFFSKKWLIIKNRIYLIFPLIRRVLVSVLIVIFLVISFYILNKYYGQIKAYFIRLNIDSNGNSTGFFSSLFMTLGASVLTVLAITFSLSLFAIQQAADKHTPTILRTYLKDKVNRAIFLIIAFITFAFFLFALFPIDSLLIYEVILGFFFLILIFYLLRKQYHHTANLVNPIYQIIYYHNNGIKLLNRIDKHIDALIKAKIVRPSPESDIVNRSKEEQRDLLRTRALMGLPELFEPVKNCLNEIYALIQTYQKRKDYQVTYRGFYSIYSLVHRYVEAKNGAFFPSSIIQELDYSHDDFLEEILEKLTTIQRIASKEKDFEISKQILDCFFQIAIKCTEIRYRTNPLNEYTHCMLTTGYMKQNILEGLNAGLIDIGIQGSNRLRTIGSVLIAKGSIIDTNLIFDYLSEIAMYGLLPNTNYLIASPMKAYTILLRAILYNRNIDHQLLSKRILEKAQYIIGSYVRMKEIGMVLVEMEFSIGDFVVLSKRTAIPYIFDEIYNKIQDSKTSNQDKKHFIKKIIDFGGDVWNFYDELSRYAAEKESFLIHYIDSNLEHITLALFRLYQIDTLDANQKKEILKNIKWIISVYWRIYEYHKEITKSYEDQILWNLLKIGSEFNKLSLIKELNEVINIIVSIANSFLEKQKWDQGFGPIRILEKAAYLCIFDGSEEVYTNFLKQIKDKFWIECCKKYPEHKALLFNELLQIDPVDLKLNRPHLTFEDELLCKLSKEDISKFVGRLRNDLA